MAAAPPRGDIQYAKISVSSSGDNQLVAGVTGCRIIVINYVVCGASAVNGKFRSNTTDLTGAMPMNPGIGGSECSTGHFTTAAGETLNLNLSGAVAVTGHLSYILASN